MKLERQYMRTGRGYRLVLWEDTSRAEAGKQLVILCHGLGTTHRNHLVAALAEKLTSRGYPALVFDFAGYGETGGGIAQRTVSNFINDLKDVVTWARTTKRIPPQGSVVVGHSIGALTALLAAPALTADLRGIVLIGCNAKSAAKYRQLGKQGRIRKLTRYLIVGSSKVALNFWDDRKRFEPERFARRITIPVLLMCGTDDVTNPPDESRMLSRWLKGSKKLVTIPGTDHYFREPAAQRHAARTILTWLTRLQK